MVSEIKQENSFDRPSKIRLEILSEHHDIRKMIKDIKSIIKDKNHQELTLKLDVFFAQLKTHMQNEEVLLGPALENVDSWGKERLGRLKDEHKIQRNEFADLQKAYKNSANFAEAAAIVLKFFDGLNLEMKNEETEFLDPNVIKDDVITSNNIGG